MEASAAMLGRCVARTGIDRHAADRIARRLRSGSGLAMGMDGLMMAHAILLYRTTLMWCPYRCFTVKIVAVGKCLE